MRTIKLLTLLGLTAVLASNVAAASNWGTSSYTGLGYVDEDQFDDESFSGSTSLVYRFNDTLGIEGGYTKFGDFKNNFDAIEGSARAEASIDGFSLGLNVLTDISESWYFTGRVGFWAWQSDAKIQIPGSTTLKINSDGTDFYAGVGVGYKFSERFGAGLGYSYYSVDVGDSSSGVYIIGLNTTYRF
jgi:hypothetical protein